MRFRKKPAVVDAVQWKGDNRPEMERWSESIGGKTFWDFAGARLIVRTLEGDMLAIPGDWIVCREKGDCYPVKPDVFSDTYELCDDADSASAAAKQ